jgi:hypothetical protein
VDNKHNGVRISTEIAFDFYLALCSAHNASHFSTLSSSSPFNQASSPLSALSPILRLCAHSEPTLPPSTSHILAPPTMASLSPSVVLLLIIIGAFFTIVLAVAVHRLCAARSLIPNTDTEDTLVATTSWRERSDAQKAYCAEVRMRLQRQVERRARAARREWRRTQLTEATGVVSQLATKILHAHDGLQTLHTLLTR